jgi:Abnormal spindle-like microcephaly-assoc'd, ASPM-SPD-2-Hydin
MVGFSGNAGKRGRAGRAFLILVLGLSAGLCVKQSSAQAQATAQAQPSAQSRATAEAQSTATAALEVVPEVIHFVDVPVGETYTQTVRLANLGKTAMQVKKISMGAASFGVTGFTSPLVLQPGSNANITISYHPKAAEHLTAEMKIVTSADAAPVTVDVTATAIGGETELAASEASVHFDDIAVGGRSVKEVRLTNTGNRDVTISQISVSSADFTVTGGNQVRLTPGQAVSLEVGFTPRDGGERSGILSVLADGGNAVQIPLSGSGAKGSQSAIRLKWEDSPLGAQGYRVYRSSETGGPYLPVSGDGVNSADYTDTGVAAGHTYYYVVTSMDANNQESEFSEQITVTAP